MIVKRNRYNRLLPKVLLRILPVALIALILVWIATRQIAVHAVQTEVENSLHHRVTDTSKVISDRINALKQDIQVLSNNDLVINGLIDMTARQNYLPMFFQSLSIAGSLDAEIVLADYKGRYIISNTGRKVDFRQKQLLEQISEGKEILEISAERLQYAIPVKYQGLVEGMLVVFIDERMVTKFFALEKSELTSVLLDGIGGTITTSNDQNRRQLLAAQNSNESDWFYTNRSINAYPTLLLISGISKKQAFYQIDRLDIFFVMAMLFNLVALVAGIVLSSLMSTRPLSVFSLKLKEIRERQNYHDRLPETGPLEFSRLARSFNALQAELMESVIFNEQLEEMVEERTRKLKDVQAKLVNRAIESGRAQLSAMILHNIGNAMTPVSVNVSQLKQDELELISKYMSRSYQDLTENIECLTEYVNTDARGKEVFAFLGKLIHSLEQQRADFKNSLEKISEAVKYVSEIISLQQNYAAGESENRESTDINRLLDDAVKMQATALEKRGIEIRRETDTNLPLLTIDRNKLMQVVVNLIKNGYEAIDEAETDTGEKFITLRTLSQAGRIRIEIIDSGVGIEPDQVNRVLRFGESGKGSSGFGLYYCKMFVEANNGEFALGSRGKGEGATVTIIFNPYQTETTE